MGGNEHSGDYENLEDKLNDELRSEGIGYDIGSIESADCIKEKYKLNVKPDSKCNIGSEGSNGGEVGEEISNVSDESSDEVIEAQILRDLVKIGYVNDIGDVGDQEKLVSRCITDCLSELKSGIDDEHLYLSYEQERSTKGFMQIIKRGDATRNGDSYVFNKRNDLEISMIQPNLEKIMEVNRKFDRVLKKRLLGIERKKIKGLIYDFESYLKGIIDDPPEKLIEDQIENVVQIKNIIIYSYNKFLKELDKTKIRYDEATDKGLINMVKDHNLDQTLAKKEKAYSDLLCLTKKLVGPKRFIYESILGNLQIDVERSLYEKNHNAFEFEFNEKERSKLHGHLGMGIAYCYHLKSINSTIDFFTSHLNEVKGFYLNIWRTENGVKVLNNSLADMMNLTSRLQSAYNSGSESVIQNAKTKNPVLGMLDTDIYNNCRTLDEIQNATLSGINDSNLAINRYKQIGGK